MGLLAPLAHSGAYTDAHYLLYDGTDPEFTGVYSIGEPYLPPSVRLQPLKSAKEAMVTAVDAMITGGIDDRVGAVAFSSIAQWVEPLTADYARVRAKLRGAPLGVASGLSVGLEAARLEFLSGRARPKTAKVMVLVTDGRSGSMNALTEAQAAAQAGITIHVVGVGPDADRVLLDEIAAIGGGTATYVDMAVPAWVYTPVLQAALVNAVTTGSAVSLVE
ncbi:MAG: vWA domain-containing protein [Phycisphaerae bacterium]